jgi:23S rRNA (adenine2503-C2)-methyltransferase
MNENYANTGEHKQPLFGKTLDELKEIIQGTGAPGYTAKQVTDWIYKKDVDDIEAFSNISLSIREKLEENFIIGKHQPTNVQVSKDGTKKYLYPVSPGRFIETAYIPDKDRSTLCLSSQVGCKMGCHFCMTGKQGYQGNLKAGEIINQFYSLPEKEKITNIVYMGMGEPLDNLEEVLKSLEILTSAWGTGMSPRRITVSSIGIIKGLREFLEKSQCHLAISLHTPFQEERKQMMPVEKHDPIQEVIGEIKKHDFSGQRRVSFEYIMFKGVNDTPRHVKGLTSLLNGIKCRVNLIKFHDIPDSPWKGSNHETMLQFRDQLTARGIVTTIRTSRGEDIQAACGLLSTSALKK